MSIADKITQLTTIRASMREKLAAKGVDASTHNFADFPNDVESIVASEAVITAYYCGANATVTATLGNDTYTATADGDGTANIFVGKTGTYTISSTGTAITKTCVVSAVHAFYDVILSDAQTIISRSLFYTDFDGRITNLNNNANYSITADGGSPVYTSGARRYLERTYAYTARYNFSSDFQAAAKNGTMTILTAIKLTGSFSDDKGSRIFDFYNPSQTQTQGATIYGQSVRGMHSDRATEVTQVELNKWFVLAIRKEQGATTKKVSVFKNNELISADVNDTATYGLVRFLSTQSYALVLGNFGWLMFNNEYLTDGELSDVSSYVLANIN